VIDEAYHQYALPSAMYPSFGDHPLADDRVIVTRTFSKVFGLAGLRLGYAVAHPAVIEKVLPS
jgi:histidinol-phosphate aminotransferase